MKNVILEYALNLLDSSTLSNQHKKLMNKVIEDRFQEIMAIGIKEYNYSDIKIEKDILLSIEIAIEEIACEYIEFIKNAIKHNEMDAALFIAITLELIIYTKEKENYSNNLNKFVYALH
jgi:hypothetical protein